MRYLFGFLCVCVLSVVPLPLSASAQDAKEATTDEPNVQESAPSSEPASEEPALRLELAPAGVDIVPRPARTVDGYTLEEMELRVRRARIGLISSAAVLVVGGVLLGVAGASANIATGENLGLLWGGVALAGVGSVGMIATGILLGVRKRKRRRLQEADYGRPRKVQWDPAQWRLLF
ncbi:MAG: hypothetical protein OER77_00815 [Myxococcales bacterium]|nr:hypothetical protein [Myxococcales bacterium]